MADERFEEMLGNVMPTQFEDLRLELSHLSLDGAL